MLTPGYGVRSYVYLKSMIAVIGPLKKTTVICEYSVRFDQPKWKDYLKILFRLEFFQEMTFPFAIRISSRVPFPRGGMRDKPKLAAMDHLWREMSCTFEK